MSRTDVLFALLLLEFGEPQGLHICTPKDYGCLLSALDNPSDNSKLELGEGLYPINKSVIIENVSNVTIHGKGLGVILYCRMGSGGLSFINVTNLTIRNVVLKSCTVADQNALETRGRIHVPQDIHMTSYSFLIALCGNILLDKVSVENSSDVGLVLINVWDNTYISRSNFTDNGNGGLLLISADSITSNTVESMHFGISSCQFIANTNSNSGGGLAVILAQTTLDIQINVTDCMFEGNTANGGGGMYVGVFSDVTTSSVQLEGCVFLSNTAVENGGGMLVEVGLESAQLCSCSLTSLFFINVSNSSYVGNLADDGGAIRVFSSLRQSDLFFGLYSALLYNNSALKASAISCAQESNFRSIGKTDVVFEECIIQDNISPDFPSVPAAAVIVNGAKMMLRSHNFILDTLGTGIKITEGEVHINGTALLSGNIGINGGALQLLGGSTIVLYNNSILNIANNQAVISGGGIYVHGCGSSECCFINPMGTLFHDCQFKNYFRTEINFHGNQALIGTSIYGPSLNCSWIADFIEDFYSSCSGKHFMVFNDTNIKFSMPGNLQLSTGSWSAKPGTVLSIPVKSYDEFNQLIEDVLIYQIIDSNSRIISSSTQVINSISPLLVTATGAQNETIDIEIISTLSLSNVRVRVTLGSCGIGYWYNESTQSCHCHKNFSLLKVQCTLDSITTPENNIWLGTNRAKDQLLWGVCPRQYCKNELSVVIDNDFDFQCEFNRSGILCSECLDGHSVTLSSSRGCKKCSNTSLLLVLGVLLIGFVIVIAIAFCRVDIANGYVLSVIFHCNILSVYGTHLIPKDWQIIFIGIDIISLKLNLYACLYDGMTNLWAIMVQFAFIGYILLLVGVACAVVYRITLPESHANIPTKAVPTIILMCQMALMELCTSGFSYVSIHSLDSGSIIHRWQASPDLAYIRSLHALPFSASIVSVILFLLPMVLVLTYPPCPYRLAILGKLKPVYDVVWAPFRAKRHWWLIFRILVSWVIFICAISISHVGSSIFALCLILASLLFLQVQLKPYVKKWINCLDELLLLVLLLMAIGRLYGLPTRENFWFVYILILTSCFYAIIILVAIIHFYTILPILLNDITSISQCLRVCIGKCCVKRRHDFIEADLEPMVVPSTEVSIAGLRNDPDLNDNVVMDTAGDPLPAVATMGPVRIRSDPVAAVVTSKRSAEEESALVDKSTNKEQFYTCRKVHSTST